MALSPQNWDNLAKFIRAGINGVDAGREYDKDVILVETGYQNRPGRYFKELPGPYPETPEGQKQLLEDLNAIVMSVSNGRGKGIYWWEPGNTGARGFFGADGDT